MVVKYAIDVEKYTATDGDNLVQAVQNVHEFTQIDFIQIRNFERQNFQNKIIHIHYATGMEYDLDTVGYSNNRPFNT